jgi:hypothetical protein
MSMDNLSNATLNQDWPKDVSRNGWTLLYELRINSLLIIKNTIHSLHISCQRVEIDATVHSENGLLIRSDI